jgi:hypothetical protein
MLLMMSSRGSAAQIFFLGTNLKIVNNNHSLTINNNKERSWTEPWGTPTNMSQYADELF